MTKSSKVKRNMSIVLSLVLAVGVLVTAYIIQKTQLNPTKTDASGRIGGFRNLIVMGDSISVGAGASSKNKSYAALLYDNLLEKNPKLKYLNVAQGGSTTDDIVRQMFEAKRQLGGSLNNSLVVMTIGGNDILGMLKGKGEQNALGSAVANLNNAIQMAGLSNNVSLVLSTVYDPTSGAPRNNKCYRSEKVFNFLSDELFKKWKVAYMGIAKKHPNQVFIADAYSRFIGHGVGQNDTWFDDCVHPNNKGHKELKDVFWDTINSNL